MQDQMSNALNRAKTKACQPLLFWLAAVGAVVVVVAAYSSQLNEKFQPADRQNIQGNLYIQNLEALYQLVRNPRERLHVPDQVPYRPVLSFSLAIDYWVGGGLEARAYRFSQMVLMMGLGAGFFAWFLFLANRANEHWANRFVALLAAMVFCVHVTNSEIISDVSSRSTLLGTFGIVGSLLMYAYLPIWRNAHLYLIPMILGSLAHPMAVLFAPLLLVYGLLFEKRISCREWYATRSWPKVKHAIGKTLPAFVTGMGLLLFLDSVRSTHLAEEIHANHTMFQQPFMWFHSLWLFVFPYENNAWVGGQTSFQWLNLPFFSGLLGVLVLGRILWVSSGIKALRPVAFGIAWFLLGSFGVGSRINEGEGLVQPEFLFSFMGLTLALMTWIAYRLKQQKLRDPRLWFPKMVMVGLMFIVVLAFHVVGTTQLTGPKGVPESPQTLSGLEKPVSQSPHL